MLRNALWNHQLPRYSFLHATMFASAQAGPSTRQIEGAEVEAEVRSLCFNARKLIFSGSA